MKTGGSGRGGTGRTPFARIPAAGFAAGGYMVITIDVHPSPVLPFCVNPVSR